MVAAGDDARPFAASTASAIAGAKSACLPSAVCGSAMRKPLDVRTFFIARRSARSCGAGASSMASGPVAMTVASAAYPASRSAVPFYTSRSFNGAARSRSASNE